MIRVMMEVDVHGLGLTVRKLAEVIIVNDGTGTPTRGNYNLLAIGKNGRTVRKGRIENWQRKTKPSLALLSAALQELGYHKLT